MKKKKVDILLSTYNGDEFLEELLDSIIEQTYDEWQLLIRDDGSTDGTIKILHAYKEKYPDKITLIIDDKGNLGVLRSYSLLLGLSINDYIMLCDQDDVWLPEKVEHSVNVIEKFGASGAQPLMVFTDLKVVDQDRNVISDSFFKYRRLNAGSIKLQNLLLQNVATGCTIIMNQELKKMVLPIPDQAIMHDWWIALNASITDGLRVDHSSFILYRQHAQNTIGAKRPNMPYVINRLKSLQKMTEEIEKISLQAQALLERHGHRMNLVEYKTTAFVAQVLCQNRRSRIYNCLRYGVSKSNLLKDLVFLVLLLILKVRRSGENK